jgi:probable rRNA maturation factor
MIHIQIAEALEGSIFVHRESDTLAEEERQERTIQALVRAAEQTLQTAGANPNAELTIVLSDDAQLQHLNRQFLGVDAPTDVLAFPGGETDPDSQALYLGDVILSVQRAAAQAAAAGHSTQDELCLLVVHGVLHLLGHDHADEEEKAVMWALQGQILEQIGCAIKL